MHIEHKVPCPTPDCSGELILWIESGPARPAKWNLLIEEDDVREVSCPVCRNRFRAVPLACGVAIRTMK